MPSLVIIFSASSTEDAQFITGKPFANLPCLSASKHALCNGEFRAPLVN